MTERIKERNTTFKNNLKSARRIKGIIQKVAAEKIGIKASSLSAYEEGRTEPPYLILEKIIVAYGIPKSKVNDFIFGDYPTEKKAVSQEY